MLIQMEEELTHSLAQYNELPATVQNLQLVEETHTLLISQLTTFRDTVLKYVQDHEDGGKLTAVCVCARVSLCVYVWMYRVVCCVLCVLCCVVVWCCMFISLCFYR